MFSVNGVNRNQEDIKDAWVSFGDYGADWGRLDGPAGGSVYSDMTIRQPPTMGTVHWTHQGVAKVDVIKIPAVVPEAKDYDELHLVIEIKGEHAIAYWRAWDAYRPGIIPGEPLIWPKDVSHLPAEEDRVD